MPRLLACCLLCAWGLGAQAGEIRHARVERHGADYRVEISALVEGSQADVYRIATDFERLAELSDIVQASDFDEYRDGDGARRIRRRLETRTCVLLLCFDAVVVEDVWMPGEGIIRTAIVPSGSDFVHGEGQWEILSAGDDTTIINFTSSFDPDFFIPPVIGSLLIKRMMLDATNQTIGNIERLVR